MIFVNPNSKINRNIPNVGLMYVATYYGAKVIDQNTMPYPKDRFLKHETDVLGISVRSLNYNESIRIAELYRSKHSAAKIKSVSGFLKVLCSYPYLEFDDKIVHNEPFSDSIPFPAYDLLDSFSLFRENWQTGKWRYAIVTSRGCPYQCIYCVSRNTKWEARSAENCYEELKLAKKKWGIKSFEILDECFNFNKDRVIEFCELIEPLKLNWFCTNAIRADRFDEDMAKAMAESSCKLIGFGVESAVPDVLRAIRKGETIEQIEQAIDIAKKYFANVNGFFIIGLPKSSYEKDLYSLAWAMKKGINAHFSYYVPFDCGVQFNNLFYGGEGAHPLSDNYPKELQRRIYELTECMRPSFDRDPLKRTLNRIKLVSIYDKDHLPAHFIATLRELASMLRGKDEKLDQG